MYGPPQHSPAGHKRSAQEQSPDVFSPSKIPLFQQGSTPQQQWQARQPLQQHSPQQHNTVDGAGASNITPGDVCGGRDIAQWQRSPPQWQQLVGQVQQDCPHQAAGTSSGLQQHHQQQQHPVPAQPCIAIAVTPQRQQQLHPNQQTTSPSPTQQAQWQPAAVPQQLFSAGWATQQHGLPHHHQQQQRQKSGGTADSCQQQQWQQQPMPSPAGWSQDQTCGPQVHHVQQGRCQQQQQQQWSPSLQCQHQNHQQHQQQQQQHLQVPAGQAQAPMLLRQQQQHVPPSPPQHKQQVPPSPQLLQQQQPAYASSPSGTTAAWSRAPAAACGTVSNINSSGSAGWTNTPVAARHPPATNLPRSPASTTIAPAAAAAATPGSSAGSSSGCSQWSPSIWRLICRSFHLQSLVVSHNIRGLCQQLGLEEHHVRSEVLRLNKWFALIFPLRLVLEQFGVLDFVSTKTLLQLTHLPPQQLSLLDKWLKEDRAAAAAAAAPGGGSSGLRELTAGPLSTKYSSYWDCSRVSNCSDVPPSWAVLQLVRRGRIRWLPAPSPAAAAAAATTNVFTAAGHGSYVWQHGPVDAWLSDNTSSSNDAAAARSMRADVLKQSWYPRTQAKLLLDPAFPQPSISNGSSGSSGASHDVVLGFGYLEVGFLDEQLQHSSSCHLQRHPVLADHDRLIRVTQSKTAAAAAGAGRSDDGYDRALKGLLTYGVMLAGRRYKRLIQKDVGQAGESLWLLAVESVAPEDTSGPDAWPATNPAAARQLLGAFSSLPSISKQSARGALLVSNTLPFKVCARQVLYIPDIQGPTDVQGNLVQQPAGSSSSSVEVCMTDGSGYISADLARLVPAISAGEIIAGDRGGGVVWPTTPLQVRVFDPHFGGVIAKGTLNPLIDSVLPAGTLVLRASQVKAPSATHFWARWTQHWTNMLLWAHQQQQQQQGAGADWWQQQQQQRVGRQPGQAAVVPCVWQQQQQQQSEGTIVQRDLAGVGQGVTGADGSPWQQQQTAPAARSTNAGNLLAQAAAAAAVASSRRRPHLEFVHPQDRSWLQQLWYVHDAMQLSSAGSSSSSRSNTSTTKPPPKACQQQQRHAAKTCSTHSCNNGVGTSSSGSGSYCGPAARAAGAAAGCCRCECVVEVVSRAPSYGEKAADLRINKNLLLLLHHAGVPQRVFEEWSDIEQHQLVGIDSSYDKAYAAARAAGEVEVVHKLDALIGMRLQHPAALESSSTLTAAAAATGVATISSSISNLTINHAGHAPPGAAMPGGATAFSTAAGPRGMVFQPDLALKEELHAIKLRRRQKMANMSLPVPSAADTAAAVQAGIEIRAEENTFTTPAAAGGVRLLGLPDPTCGCVPEGCVAVSPGLVPPKQEAVIYRDPGIHPGDVRRVRVIPYPPQLLLLLPPHFCGAVFLPTAGSSCLGAALAGGDYDGDQYLVLWDERVTRCCRAQDPEPYQASPGGGGERWMLPEGAGWELVEERLTEFYSFCCQVSGTIGEAHTLWEAYADQKGLDNPFCTFLVDAYYKALDAAKTGQKPPEIPPFYKKNPTIDINYLPPWHSRLVKESTKNGNRSGLAVVGGPPDKNSSTGNSLIIRALWSRLQELDPVNYLDKALLCLDPDLVLQEGPCAVSREDMEQRIARWDRLCDVWNREWAQILSRNGAAWSRAEQRSLTDEKTELMMMLRAKFEVELWGGLEAVAAAVAGHGSSNILDTQLLEASACYQAVYKRAQDKQDRLNKLTKQQREQQAQERGYEDKPRVTMAWRVAGQWLRMLKATKPHRLQQVRLLQQLQQSSGVAGVTGPAGQAADGFVGGLAGGRFELGTIQHPYQAALVAQQQSRRGQLRRNWDAAGAGELL